MRRVQIYTVSDAFEAIANQAIEIGSAENIVVEVFQGGVAGALNNGGANNCSLAMLIEVAVDTTKKEDVESLMVQLEKLAPYCVAETSIGLLTPADDEDFSSQMQELGMLGATGVPKNIDELSAAISIVMDGVPEEEVAQSAEPERVSTPAASPQTNGSAHVSAPSRAANRPASGRGGSVIALVGAVGGVGTTSLASVFSSSLADEVDQDIALVDLDFGSSRLQKYLNVSQRKGLGRLIGRSSTLEEDSIIDCGADVANKVMAWPCSNVTLNELNGDGEFVPNLLRWYKDLFDYVVLDCGLMSEHKSTEWLGFADLVIVVTDDQPISVSQATEKAAMIKQMSPSVVIGYIVNRRGARGKASVASEEVNDALRSTPITSVPYLPTVFDGEFGSLAAILNRQVEDKHLDAAIDPAVMQVLSLFSGNAASKPAEASAVSSEPKGVLGRTLDLLWN